MEKPPIQSGRKRKKRETAERKRSAFSLGGLRNENGNDETETRPAHHRFQSAPVQNVAEQNTAAQTTPPATSATPAQSNAAVDQAASNEELADFSDADITETAEEITVQAQNK